MKESKAKREAEAKAKQAKLAAAKKKSDKEKAKAEAKELAEKKKEDQTKAKALAEKTKLKAQKERQELAKKKKADEASEKALAEKKKLKDLKRKQELAEKKKSDEGKKSKALAAKKLAADKRKARELASARSSNRGGGFGGLFSSFSSGRTSSKYKSEGHYVYVNQVLLSSLSPANAKVEIDLGDQRVRVYKTGAKKQLVIESSVSSGKPGHNTPTGTFRIKEKLTAKRSTLYGRWTNSSGSTIPSAGESGSRPSGATTFVGASMPYWMRINGGVGMHIGHVPNYPASHGCIRVPSSVQPLIFSKVGVGTSVTIMH